MSSKDIRYMRMAIKLARKGAADRSGKPLVGAVAVAAGRAVGHGFAGSEAGGLAALQALQEAGRQAAESTLYTNVEPCLDDADNADIGDIDHYDCLKRLIGFRPQRVVIGVSSESHIASPGKVIIDTLRGAGIRTETGVCAAECSELNEVSYKLKRTGLPFVTVKVACTLDGRIATASGDSQWISGKRSLKLAHELRRDHDAVLVGIGTVLKDDPRLTVRLVNGRDPLRIVVDSRLRTPVTARLLSNGGAGNTIFAVGGEADASKIEQMRRLGAEVLVLPLPKGPSERANSDGSVRVNLSALLTELGRRGIGSVLVEGGGAIITALLARRQVDRMVIAIAPKIIGRGIDAVGDLKIDLLKDALTFSSLKTKKLGQDIIFDGRLSHPETSAGDR